MIRRKTNVTFPEGITQDMLPEYVHYYTEKISKERYREYFRIEGHPALKIGSKPTTTKSVNVTINQKLLDVISMVRELDNINTKNIVAQKL